MILPLLVAHLAAQVRFTDVAQQAGLEFTHQYSPTPRKHLIESVPGGVAAFDYDNDGLTDIFFTNGAALPSLQKTSPAFHNRLFRNRGGWRFEDVTAKAGVAGAGYSIGAAAGDFDNDGRVDLFVAGYRRNLLYRNNGDGTFRDVTASSGIASNAFSVAAGWFDYDNDGLLDLFVVNYLNWTPGDDRFCGDRAANLRVYCHPRYYSAVPNTLYRNRGNGVFEDVSTASGIAVHPGKGMSVTFADFNAAGRMDAFVTNDAVPDFLFLNQSGGRFREAGLAAGVALNQDGRATSSMGVDAADYDNDGRPDIVLTALSGETFPLFRNSGSSVFSDSTQSSGLAAATRKRAGWSVAFGDFNNDGRKDLFAAGGHVNDRIERFESTSYKQPNSLFLNIGNGRFQDHSPQAGFITPRAHRGSAIADFDQDGRLDLVVVCLGEPAELWRNVTEPMGNWIAFDVPRIGAVIRLGSQTAQMTTAAGYASSSHRPVHFGLGAAAAVERVEIVWPGGKTQTIENPSINRVHRLKVP